MTCPIIQSYHFALLGLTWNPTSPTYNRLKLNDKIHIIKLKILYVRYNHGWKCHDISMIYRRYFRCRSLSDKISTNKSRIKEKSKNIDQYQRYVTDISINNQYIGHNIDYKYSAWNKTQNFTILANISFDIGQKRKFCGKSGVFGMVFCTSSTILNLQSCSIH